MTDKLNDVQRQIESYLVEQVDSGEQYFKSKYIAEDLDLTSKTVGTNLGILQEKTDRVVIEDWSGGSSGTTWLITPLEDTEDSKDVQAPSPSIVTVAQAND